MALFTVIVEFRGGTYVQQATAANSREAVAEWARRFKADDTTSLAKRTRDSFARAAIADGDPVPLAGLSHVWCLRASVEDSGAWLHIVHTAESGQT